MFGEFFPLNLFPQGGLTSSVITTVWVGVFVVAFFNLRLGWVLSGLVVPGYLVPLIIMKPWSAGVILLEAVVTYLIVRFFSDYLSRYGYWSSIFGRDRFFALVLVSVIVRLVFDSYLLPGAGAWLEAQWQIQFDYRNNLYSFGLIIIALIANQFWKTGFWRGVIPITVTLAVTYVIIRYGLMTMTNFTMSNLGYMYEDLASSVLASPKAYIILLTSAFIASRLNLRYGWDYNGILLPSLIALQWYQPMKVLTSFVEAFVILIAAILLLRTPLFSNSNIEGARKLLLFFNIGFIYKFILGYVILTWFPDIQATDTYGFGYLLATLMAIKMHDKNIAARLTRTTLQTSLVSVVIASCVGFALTLIPSWHERTPIQTALHTQLVVELPDEAQLIDLVREEKVEMYRHRGLTGVTAPLPHETDKFNHAIERLLRFSDTSDEKHLYQSSTLLSELNYQLLRVNQRYLFLREKRPSRGWGMYVFDPQSPGNLLIEAPAPLEERGTLEAATRLFENKHARGLAIANARRSANADGSADVLRNPQSFYHQFHRILSRRDVLQVRAYTAEKVRILAGLRRDQTQIVLPEPESHLWVHESLPPSVDLNALKTLIDTFELDWNDAPFVNLQRDVTQEGFAELILNRADLRRLVARSLTQTVPVTNSQQRIDGHLLQWLLHSKGNIAERGSNLYQIPEIWELMFLDEEVLTPLWHIIEREQAHKPLSEESMAELQHVNAAASILGYQVLQYRHIGSGNKYIILAEREDAAPRRYWGTLIFRLGEARDYMVQVPRPFYETSSFELGVSLFERMNAKVLLIAGAHPLSNADGAADVANISQTASMFTLSQQVILRELQEAPLMVLQSRAYGYREHNTGSHADILIALRNGEKEPRDADELTQYLLSTLHEDQLTYKLVNGSKETAGYEITGNPQAISLNATRNKTFALLWGSPQARASFRQQSEKRQESAHFRVLGIESSEADLKQVINRQKRIKSSSLPSALIDKVQEYQRDQNIVTLRALQKRWPRVRYHRFIDLDSQQSYLAVYKSSRLALLANLNPRAPDTAFSLSESTPDPKQLRRFVDARAALLYFEEGA